MNRCLTYKQYCSLVVIVCTVISSLILPFISTSILSVVLGLLLSYIYFLCYINLKKKRQLNPKFVKNILALKYVITTGILIALFCQVINHIFGKNLNIYALMLLILFCGAYCGCKNEVVFRVSRMLYIFILIPFLLAIIFSVGDINFSNVLNSFKFDSIYKIISISFICMLFEIPALLMDFCKFDINVKKYSFSYIVSAIFILLYYICVVGKFGDKIYNYKYVGLELIYSLQLPVNFLQRKEGILISLIIMGFIVAVSLFTLFSVQPFLKSNKKYIYLFFIFVVSVICLNIQNIVKYYIIVNIVLSVFVMILLIFFGGRKDET